MQFRAVARGAHLADSMRWPRIVAWITECLWRACNRTVAVIDSCEIPAKHNYNNSAAADQRGIGSRPPITRLLTLLCILCRDVRGWGEGISVVFHLANSRNSSAHVSPPPPSIRGRGRGGHSCIPSCPQWIPKRGSTWHEFPATRCVDRDQKLGPASTGSPNVTSFLLVPLRREGRNTHSFEPLRANVA